MIQVVVLMVVQVAVLFAAAGTLHWLRAWIYVGSYFVFLAISAVVLFKKNPELINQRGEMKSGTKGFDKVFITLSTPLPFIMLAVAGLDVRFGWSFMPFSLVTIGITLWVLAAIFTIWAMAVNIHFETTVRVQAERSHQVCTAGPYQYVRHPGYVGMILSNAGTPLMLGSWWAFLPCCVVVILFVIRTALEDCTLCSELAGYAAYARTVQYRLLPGLW